MLTAPPVSRAVSMIFRHFKLSSVIDWSLSESNRNPTKRSIQRPGASFFEFRLILLVMNEHCVLA
jgi:hypothetical protein